MTPLETAQQRIAELERELDNERARGIHSCGPTCSNSGCVNRSLREQLAELEAIIAEAGKQKPASSKFIMSKDGNRIVNFYAHPDYASAARIKELEADKRRYFDLYVATGNENTALREKLRVARESLKAFVEIKYIREAMIGPLKDAVLQADGALVTIGDE